MAHSNPAVRGNFKYALSRMRLGILWARITSNWFIGIYFALALTSSIVLAALQGVAYSDNYQAVALTDSILDVANVNSFPVVNGDKLKICSVLPNKKTSCTEIIPAAQDRAIQDRGLFAGLNVTEISERLRHKKRHSQVERRDLSITRKLNADNVIEGVRLGEDVELSMECVTSIVWIHETLREAKSEDVVILVFDIWLFSLGLLAVLTESIPHLIASVAAHIIGTIWAAVRIRMAQSWLDMYKRYIVEGSCNGTDFLGAWWDVRARHATPVLFINALATFAMAYISLNIYRLYSKASFGRAGTSAIVQRTYKFVLLFSALLQIAGFFNLAAAAIWIDKITTGAVKSIVSHAPIYEGLFIVIAILLIPWMITGWMSVRRESRIMFIVFSLIGSFPLTMTPFMFASDVYSLVFREWPFFATITITAYVLVVSTLATGIFCRLQFGKGLAHFLKVEQQLEDIDFTPVYMSNDPEKQSDSSRFSLSGELPFPEETVTKRLRAVPSIDLASPSDTTSVRTSIFAASSLSRSRVSSLINALPLPPPLRLSSSQVQVNVQAPSPQLASRFSVSTVGRCQSTSTRASVSVPALSIPQPKQRNSSTYVLRPISPISTFHAGSTAVSRNTTASTVSAPPRSRASSPQPPMPAVVADPKRGRRARVPSPEDDQRQVHARSRSATSSLCNTMASPPPVLPLPPVPTVPPPVVRLLPRPPGL
ncbi:hypothetical protein HGRIS_006957 [Hohenbuehelia grisea]|uniref:Uncharacterized protein n=1 Tax=Hohenbuehelia grisea TaxID=104357 RepID=A0ABR3JAP7_9AGAR